MLETLLFSVSVTAPIFVWILVGSILRALGVLSERIIGRLSQFVFYVSLPLLMFFGALRRPIAEVFDFGMTLVGVATTLLVWAASLVYVRSSKFSAAESSVVQQGALRGNLGIVGISLCFNAYGAEALVRASMLMALLTVTYNLLCVYIFVSGRSEERLSWFQLIVSILKNPLIVAVALGLPLGLMGVQVSEGVLNGVDTFVALTLPLALIAIGASLNFKAVTNNLGQLNQVGMLKLVLAPFVAVSGGLLLGYRGMDLGVLFLLLASPTATASFIMAKAYGANHVLAANIVVYTTLLSLLSVSVGVFVLTVFELM